MTTQRNPETPLDASLPSFFDRIPEFSNCIKSVHNQIYVDSKQSFIPYWEEVYQKAHSLKGVLKILNCPEALAESFVRLTDTFANAVSGPFICRNLEEAKKHIEDLGKIFDQESKFISAKSLTDWITKFESMHEKDIDHNERMKNISLGLFYINPFVSKKIREVELLHLHHCVAEEEILLSDLPTWRAQLENSIHEEGKGRGLIVNLLPLISPEGSRTIKVWAWVAANTESRAQLKQHVKEHLPKCQVGSL
ncbi:MAG: hypothetical protein M9962_03455 [Oligoflexia bacterium]|nr:hypothetical protein [Oligoflexia bacterium]